MALGRGGGERQGELWIATDQICWGTDTCSTIGSTKCCVTPGSTPSSRNSARTVTSKGAVRGFRRDATSACCWSATSRGSIRSGASPGGAATACRCGSFLGLPLTEKVARPQFADPHPQPAASLGVHEQVFAFVLSVVDEQGLLSGKTRRRRLDDAGSERGDEVDRPQRHRRGLEGVPQAADARRGRHRPRTMTRPTRSCGGSTRQRASRGRRRSPTRSGNRRPIPTPASSR